MPELNPTRLSVLIIEPNLSMRAILRAIVRNIGVTTIREASDAQAGYKTFKETPVDLIFTDWSEEIDALGFLRLVRRAADSPNSTVPVVVVTGITDIKAVSKARDLGMTEFLAKPVSQKMVLSRMKSAVENPRPFVEAGKFFGPDRRRRRASFDGNDRRRFGGEEKRVREMPFDGPERRQGRPGYRGEDLRVAQRA